MRVTFYQARVLCVDDRVCIDNPVTFEIFQTAHKLDEKI